MRKKQKKNKRKIKRKEKERKKKEKEIWEKNTGETNVTVYQNRKEER